jgi:hypothetical protein
MMLSQRMQQAIRWAFAAVAALILLTFALGIGVFEGWVRVGPNWAPWGMPDLREPPRWFARLQLNSISTDGNACVQMLARGGLHHTRLADRWFAPGCGYTSVVSAQTSVAMHPALTATCSMTAGIEWYEARLDEIALRTLHARIVRIDHVGTYVCRNINRDPEGLRSEHATANAIDITAFHLSNGKTVSIAKDWRKATPESEFLHEAHEAACDLFNVVLGPDYNKAHATHFHLDLGPYRACR